MLRIRLRRVGKKKQPIYRVVVADSRSPRDGKYVEKVGLYNPLTNPPTINVDQDKVREWMRKGAQPSDTVGKLLKRVGFSAAAAAAADAETAVATPESATA